MTNNESTTAKQPSDKVMLRMHDAGLRKHIKVRAAMNERTMNAEILFLIKRGLEAEADKEGATS